MPPFFILRLKPSPKENSLQRPVVGDFRRSILGLAFLLLDIRGMRQVLA
jgi:hypothetical protein